MAEIPVQRANSASDFVANDTVVNDFKEWGFILVRNLLDEQEVSLLRQTVELDCELQAASYSRSDGEGGRAASVIWQDPADDVMGTIARSEKVAGTFEKLLGDEVYQYHAKLVRKDAKTGGALVWHQDYGYWYNNGCLFPDMGTAFIAIDAMDKENGCLKIIPKSHKAGRIEHVRVGDQAGADTERVSYLEEVLGLYHVEMSAGDALFFHSNILHRSEQNHSTRRRWAYLIAYNTKSNGPVPGQPHTRYRPLHKLPNSAIKEYRVPTSANGIQTSRKFFGRAEFEVNVPKDDD